MKAILNKVILKNLIILIYGINTLILFINVITIFL